MAYVITDNNGTYIYRDNTKKYLPIQSHGAAYRFESEDHAYNIYNNMLSKKIRKDFIVVKDTPDLPDKVDIKLGKSKEEDMKKMLCYRAIDDGKIGDWQDKIDGIICAINGIKDRNDELNEKLSNIDKEIVDIQHYIEFGNFNAYQGWVCFKILQNMLRQRRNYKNELEVLRLINDSGICSTASNLSVKISNSKNKNYTARMLDDLFRG